MNNPVLEKAVVLNCEDLICQLFISKRYRAVRDALDTSSLCFRSAGFVLLKIQRHT